MISRPEHEIFFLWADGERSAQILREEVLKFFSARRGFISESRMSLVEGTYKGKELKPIGTFNGKNHLVDFFHHLKTMDSDEHIFVVIVDGDGNSVGLGENKEGFIFDREIVA